MLFPKKTKYRKWQTGRKNAAKLNRPATRGTEVVFGSFGVKALSQARITSNQIEATRRVIVRTIGKTGKVWIRIFPDRPYTRKASEVGMGKGKGDPEGFVCDVRPGRVMFEIDGVAEDIAREALRKAGTKLPVQIKIVERK
jgi:large subunit ribosomal protein L16